MKTRTTYLALILLLSLGIRSTMHAEDLTNFGELAEPGENWSKKDGGRTNDRAYSWINFVNAESGDVLSFFARKSPGLTVQDAPIRQASIETFTSDGYAYLSTRSLGEPIADTIRNRIAQINVANAAADQRFNVESIEFSYVYERDGDCSSTMAHGYVFVLDETAVFIQHTSKHVITSELATDMAFGVIWQHFKDATSIQSGWSARINDRQQ